jgi:hypothetical protein
MCRILCGFARRSSLVLSQPSQLVLMTGCLLCTMLCLGLVLLMP